LTLINEILDMAKIDAGKMTLAFEKVNLEETAREALSFVRGLVDTEKVELRWDMEADLPQIEADPVRLRQILMNLLSNAAKFTEQGSIRLQINRLNDVVQIHVHDTGIGIASEDFGKLFTPFEQGDNAAARTIGGTGLGLPITQWLVSSHGGEISFESEVDKGTSFHISLPIRLNGMPEADWSTDRAEAALTYAAG
jgi:two-component system cell cycle sensor histidine kinase PleC